jgi:hypothetical protein
VQANSYQNNLIRFFAGVRADCGSARIAIVVGRVGNHEQLKLVGIVRNGQASAVASDGLAGLVDTDEYENDGLHYTT